MIQQLSVFSENRPGRLAKVTEIWGRKGINISAISVADAGEFGIIRMVVDKPEDAYGFLKKEGLAVSLDEVIGIKMSDEPGALANIAKTLSERDVNIKYCYAFISKEHEEAILIAKVDDIDGAIEALRAKRIGILKQEHI